MQPVAEMIEWAEELGIEGAGTRQWVWIGDGAVRAKGGLHTGCTCRSPNPFELPKPPQMPDGEITLTRFGESEYVVGQCEGCGVIVWAREEVQGEEES